MNALGMCFIYIQIYIDILSYTEKQMLLNKAVFDKGKDLGKNKYGKRRTIVDLKKESRSPSVNPIVSLAAKQYI